ncbi:hypothetical protein L915_12765 [Phytophthora nicotianae]|uniref:Uncharacterized protein n=1 Tax=Phytophthora nicotianae TaxID=4792 RepID=W2ILS9_PHYNI|nr:hypothetical protein L915_12765 [Phytophthora nicotianae]ETL35164.1 hypothetical protein L916_12675 [Phytophthora nicotianae]
MRGVSSETSTTKSYATRTRLQRQAMLDVQYMYW